MLRPLYSPKNGAWRLAYALQRKHPVNLYHMDNNSDYGFSRWKDKLAHESLMKLKTRQMEDGEFKTAANNQIHYAALSHFLVTVLFLQAKEKYPFTDKDYKHLTALFIEAIRSEPLPFERLSLVECAESMAQAIAQRKGEKFEQPILVPHLLFLVSHFAGELRLQAERFKANNHDDLQARHTIIHSASLIFNLATKVVHHLQTSH